ncbi:MAG: response regulator, partial [Planctomycetota bacterium]
GQAALEKLAAAPCAAMVTDVQMPGMDGFELLSLCAGKLPVILITAFPEQAGRERAGALGASAYIAKSDHLGVDVLDALEHRLSHQTEVIR